MKFNGKLYFPMIFTLIALFFATQFFYPSFFGLWKRPLPDLIKGHVTQKVKIRIDESGIPHIEAANNKDLFYAYGHYVASERLFQMELQRRVAKGELSELFGADFVEIDKLFRTLKAHKYLSKNWERAKSQNKIPPELREITTAFLKGVNDFIAREHLPLEFLLLGIRPKDFQEEDIMAFIGYMSYSFATSFRGGLLYNDLSKKMSAEHCSELRQRPKDLNFPIPYPQMGHIKFPKHATGMASEYDKVFHTLRGLFHRFPPFKGSNSWVVAGKRTKSGYPILANDPHISFSLPGVWFEAHLKSPTFEIYGHFLPLVPLPVIGHNENHAWAITMSKVDDMQFFEEKLNPHNPRRVKHHDNWVKIKDESETIKVKERA